MNKVLMIMIYFLILILPYDYRISAIVGFVLLILTLIWKIINKQTILFAATEVYIIIYMLISFYFVINGSDELNIFFRIVLYPFILFYLFREIYINNQIIDNILKLLSLVSFTSFIIIFFGLHNNFANFSLDYLLFRNRLNFEFWDGISIIGPTQLSSLLGFSFITLFFFLYKEKQYKYFLGCILLFQFIFIIFLSSRQTWISCALAIFFLFLYKNGKFNISKLIPRLLLIIMLSYIIIFNSPLAYYLNFSELSERALFFIDPTSDHNLNARFYRWGIALDMFSKNYFGYGFSHFGKVTNFQTPHNEFLGQLVSVGFFGSALMLLIYLSTIKKIIHMTKNDKRWSIYFFIFFIYILILSFTEYYSFAMFNLINPIIWVVFGLSHNYFNLNKAIK